MLIYYWTGSNCSSAFEKADREKFQTLFVSNAQLASAQAFRSGVHEWTIDGELYDVSSVERTGDGIKLNCFHDRDEETALEGMEKSFDQQLGTGNSKHNNSSKDDAGKDVKYFSTPGQIASISCNDLFTGHVSSLPFYMNPFIGKAGQPPRA